MIIPRPHILLILADEVGWNSVGWHSNITQSPVLDALAYGGVRCVMIFIACVKAASEFSPYYY